MGRPSLNLLLERPLPEARDQVWAGDITYIPTTKGWLYLALVSGLCSLRIVGWVVAGHLRAGLVTHALRQALHSRRPACCGIHQSRSAMANPYHDFWAESFMGTLETKNAPGRLLHRRRRFPDRTLRLYRILPPPPEALLPRLPNPGSIRSPQTLSHLNQNGSKNPLRLIAANRGEAGGQGQLPSLTVPGPAHAVTRERPIPFWGNLRLRTLQEGNALESMSTAPAGVL